MLLYRRIFNLKNWFGHVNITKLINNFFWLGTILILWSWKLLRLWCTQTPTDTHRWKLLEGKIIDSRVFTIIYITYILTFKNIHKVFSQNRSTFGIILALSEVSNLINSMVYFVIVGTLVLITWLVKFQHLSSILGNLILCEFLSFIILFSLWYMTLLIHTS